MSADGILNVYKPPGWTSFDVVRVVRRRTRARRVGHAGTLDPTAEGVLPVCIGRATRIVEYLLDAGKRYRARIRLGIVTDTYDGEGEVVRTGDPSGVTRQMVEDVLPSFAGEISQIPPAFSAVKHEGTPLYRLGRSGKPAQAQPRQVRVYSISLLAFEPPIVTIEVESGRGVYLRTLAFDLGERLGCGAHLEHLVRLAVGPFEARCSITMGELQQAFEDATWEELLYALDCALLDRYAAILGEETREWAAHGRAVELTPLDATRAASVAEGTLCRAYSQDGLLVALLRYEGAGFVWRPEKVFRPP
ncbi:MAG: tRNA pseudouridine(55) synthase TruB [Dehalococcoidia bacterium]|nr:tRNA pseudouridine(55) synthase TruB [Dehalococcoidia bacterium]